MTANCSSPEEPGSSMFMFLFIVTLARC
jgi:hypothetical protein